MNAVQKENVWTPPRTIPLVFAEEVFAQELQEVFEEVQQLQTGIEEALLQIKNLKQKYIEAAFASRYYAKK